MLFYDYLARMGCAFVMGTLIGIERQYRQRNAGLRTNILVSVGAAAFTVLSCDMTIGNGDPSRVAAQIVSGIGFIGGGLILKDGFNVRGLNTAATIWCSAACGTLSGIGLYAEAAVLVACVLITHCLFRPLCTWIEKQESGPFQYTVHVECEQNLSNKIQQIIMNVLSFDRNVKLNALFGSADFSGGQGRCQEYSVASLNMKNLMSPTPRNCVRKALILALKDSADALVSLRSK